MGHQIVCPNCHTAFTIDDGMYQSLLDSVRSETYEQDVADKVALKEAQFRAELAGVQQELALTETRHKAELKASENAKNAAVDHAVHTEREKMAEQQKSKDDRIRELQTECQTLRNQSKADTEVMEARHRAELDRVKLEARTEQQKADAHLQDVEARHQEREKMLGEELERYRSFKLKQSTKMVGESLEIFCSNQFNKIRATAFPHAEFEKDNTVADGTKGDFVFRDFDENGDEYISIMFEMKNEADDTAENQRHHNEDFYKKLDSDRRKKKCEYAVLVTMLEADSELFNQGIVDVSYRYEKMYVIRPQFFIPMITILRNSAQHSLQYKRQLKVAEEQHIDVTSFENDLLSFQKAFGRNYRLASEKFGSAVAEIDKVVRNLEKLKEFLLSSDNNLRLANDKLNRLSVDKLTAGRPVMQAAFEEARKKADADKEEQE